MQGGEILKAETILGFWSAYHKILRTNVENYCWRIFLQLRSRTQTAMQASAPGCALWEGCALQRHFAQCALCVQMHCALCQCCKENVHCSLQWHCILCQCCKFTVCSVHCKGTMHCASTAKTLCTVPTLQCTRLCTASTPQCSAPPPQRALEFNDCCCCAPVYHDYQTTPPCGKI